MKMNKLEKNAMVTAAMALLLTGCGEAAAETMAARDNTVYTAVAEESEAGASGTLQTAVTYENSEDGGHAITADGEAAEYSNGTVKKTGDSKGDEADFYGENAAVLAANGARLKLSGMEITTDGTHANAVFSYGEGTVVDISDSVINTCGNCSGGIMTTGGAVMNASDLTVHTTGNSSAAIRSDRGGGTVTVTGGTYTTDGKGSPAVYSTADITVNDAVLTATASEGVVVEGKNTVTLNNVSLNADHNQHNSNKSDYFNAVMIYQSMSGDAEKGLAGFSATGGSITNARGDIFFVNNTAADISLSGVEIANHGDGVFLRAAAAGWGREGSNGGKVNLQAVSQAIDGDIIVDDISVLNFYLKDGSTFFGAINPEGGAGEVYVELTDGSKWKLTGDSNIKSLTCDADSIDLNGYRLTVDGKLYTAGASSKGEAIEIKSSEGGRGNKMQAPGDGGKDRPQNDGKQPPQDGGKEQPQADEKHHPQSDGKQPPQDGGKEHPQADEKQHPQNESGQRPQVHGEPRDKGGDSRRKPDGEPPQKPRGFLMTDAETSSAAKG